MSRSVEREPVIDAATLASVKLICGAIASQRVLAFTYKGERRMAEPYILGHDHKDTLVLSAVQRSGGSGGGFRSFQVRGMASLEISGQKFSGAHPDYNPRDAYFERVLCQVARK